MAINQAICKKTDSGHIYLNYVTVLPSSQIQFIPERLTGVKISYIILHIIDMYVAVNKPLSYLQPRTNRETLTTIFK